MLLSILLIWSLLSLATVVVLALVGRHALHARGRRVTAVRAPRHRQASGSGRPVLR